jgi:hypothetical protein
VNIHKYIGLGLLVGVTWGGGFREARSQSTPVKVDHSAFNGIWVGRARTVDEGIASGYPIALGTTGWAPLSAGAPETRPVTNFEQEKATVEKVIAANGDVFVYLASKRRPPNYTPAGQQALQRLPGPGAGPIPAAAAGTAGSSIAGPPPGGPPAGPAAANPYARCLPRNLVGFGGGFGSALEIFQANGHVGVIDEDQTYRTIRLGVDASPFTPTYRGISIGHWEGASLIVVTTGLIGDTGGENWPMSEQAKVTDTFSISPDKKVLMIKTVYEDPKYLREPMGRMVYLDRAKPNYEFLSGSCVESVQGAAIYAEQFGSTPPK